jgi:hypothetical protein
MEYEELFDNVDLSIVENEKILYVSLDVIKRQGKRSQILSNKSLVPGNNIRHLNTLHDIGKKYSCLKKIQKYVNDRDMNATFIFTIKHDVNNLFEMSISVHR